MEITVTQMQGKVPVTIIKTSGPVDGSNYEQLIETAKIAIDAGVRDILLDLSATDYVSTAGMVAIQSIARLLRGESAASGESGWDDIHTIAREGITPQRHLKLFNPQPKVIKSLEMIGFKEFFQIFTDQE